MDMCEEIDLLLSFDPSQAQMVVEDLKMLPLHLACRPNYNISTFNMETFRRLIEAYPQAAKEKDSQGRLPLHYACGGVSYRPDNNDFVGELLKIYPEATQIRDKQQNLPLHYLFMPEQVVQFDYSGHEMEWLEEAPSSLGYYLSDADKVAEFLQDKYYILIEKELIVLIQTYPDALLQSNGEKDWYVLETLAELQYPSRQVWHTAGRLCKHAFICATRKSKQPLYHISSNLCALVANFIECPLDWTKNEGKMQDGELAGIILHYTFDALLQANHGLDSKSNLPSSVNVVRPCLQVDNNCSTVKTTLLHQLAYCSKFCDQHHLEEAVHLYLARHNAHFYQADKEKMYPFMLAAIGKNANLSFTFSMLLIFVLYQNLDDLGSRITVLQN